MPELTEERLAKAERFLAAAEREAAAGDEESAVSRAYYSVFHAAKALLIRFGRADAELWKMHKQLAIVLGDMDGRYTWFRDGPKLEGARDIRSSLVLFYSWRAMADYEVGRVSPLMSRSAVRFASEFLARTKERVHGR